MSNAIPERSTAASSVNSASTGQRRPIAQALAKALPGSLLLSAGLILSPTVLADTYTVLNTADSGAGSLRQALLDANGNTGPDTVVFDSAVTGSIGLTSGPLYITDSVDVQGPGANTLTVDGSGIVAPPLQGNGGQPPQANVFVVGALGPATIATVKSARTSGGPPAPPAPPAIDVTLSGLTVSGGNSVFGAGILASATNLSINACTVTGNTAYQFGGGIATMAKYGEGSLNVADSVISNNVAANPDGSQTVGGGVLTMGGTTTIARSSISNNTAVTGGGLVATPSKYQNAGLANLTITDSTVSGNHAVAAATYYGGYLKTSNRVLGNPYSGPPGVGGGMVAVGSQVTIGNSTISGNSSEGIGGGMALGTKYGATITISNSTVAGNQADYYGGGIVAYSDTSVAPQIRNSVIGGNSAPIDPDLSSLEDPGGPSSPTGFDLAYTLVEAPGSATLIDSGGNILNQAPLLGALANNGGSTLTQLPLAGSPLIDAGDPGFTGPANDQRGTGYERVVNGRVDMGAVEYGAGTGGGGGFSYTPVPGLGDAGKLGLGALLGLAGLSVARRKRKLAPSRR